MHERDVPAVPRTIRLVEQRVHRLCVGRLERAHVDPGAAIRGRHRAVERAREHERVVRELERRAAARRPSSPPVVS